MSETTNDTAASASPETPGVDEIVADPDPGYRWKHLIVAVVAIAVGGWFAYDGWINWPEQNRLADEATTKLEEAQRRKADDKELERLSLELKKYEKHNDAGILLQKILAIACPAFGIWWGAWTMRDTRGQLRLAGDKLHVPGHPPVAFNDIRRIDKRKWDKKGIAFLHYEIGQPPVAGVVKLDDFAYDRKPTDEILELIERNVLPSVTTEVATPTRA